MSGVEVKEIKNEAGVQLLDAAEAVTFLGGKFSKWKIYDMVRKGVIPHLKIDGRIYFRPQSLISWLEKLESCSTLQENTPSDKIRRLK